MQGTRLFHLLNELDKSTIQQLHYKCKTAQDKRFGILKKLLDSDYKNKESFQTAIESLLDYFEDITDAPKALRRFIDFACKEIEELMLQNYLQTQLATKDFLLSQVFNMSKDPYLFEYYHSKAEQSISKEENWWREKIILTHQQLQWHSHSQTKNDYTKIKELLLLKHHQNLESYYTELIIHYNTLSALYIEDNTESSFFKDLIPKEEAFQKIISETTNPYYLAQLYLAKARFSFRDKAQFFSNLQKIPAYLEQMDRDTLQYQKVNRSFNYVKILAVMNYGLPLQEALESSKIVFEVNQRYQYKDSVGFFMYQMFLILNGQMDIMKANKRKYGKFYFDTSNEMYPAFLQGLEFFLKDNLQKALLILNNLSYADSYYIALWSKLIVLKIHIKLNNKELIKIFIDRAKGYLKTNQGKFFTRQTSLELIAEYELFIKEKTIKKSAEYFKLFELLSVKSNRAN